MYDHKEIEKKWQEEWAKEKLYAAHDDSIKEKFYQLETFPYPSGAGLHVGHPKGYIAEDIHARFKRAQGYEVLYTMGWDAFGLPTENYAIKIGKNPKEVAAENIANFKRQVQMFGLSYDWDREINTSDPSYYKWTQWLFLQLYKEGLAYKAKAKVNWCPKDQTVLANEQVINGRCERDGELVEQREMEQWFFRITDYAERLLSDLNGLDWPGATIKRQKDWIGKSEGAQVKFYLRKIPGQQDDKHFVEVYTTRPDTIFGATFLVISPEVAKKWIDVGWLAPQEVKEYIEQGLRKRELDRMEETREKTGIFAKFFAFNPATNQEIPVWVADYVLGSYGTGAIMAVPAHDERDLEFAKKYDLGIVKVIKPDREIEECYTGEGMLINSGEFSETSSSTARVEMAVKFGQPKVQYKLRDWSVSRQRYWGVPIPMIHCPKCGLVPVPDKELPVILPDDVEFRPKGMPPLASSETFMNVTCPNCGSLAKRDPETLDTFVDSSWYYLRYTDPTNVQKFADKEKLKRWLPVDLYAIGAEHTVLHLLYSRFITKFLFDQGFVHTKEPFLKLRHVGLIQGDDGQKMSKSKGNVVNPDPIVEELGADTLRIYEMFMGPFEAGQPWDTKGVQGSNRFLQRVWRYQENFTLGEPNPNIHKLIKKITTDIPAFKFNTAVAAFMEFMNENKEMSKNDWETFLRLLAPFAPHITEELWHMLGHSDSIHTQAWPKFDLNLVKDESVEVIIQINGKKRGQLSAPSGISETEMRKLIETSELFEKLGLNNRGAIQKIIFVQNRLINFVMKE